MITQELVKKIFEYQKGELFWKIQVSNKKIGDKAGRKQTLHYFQTRINGKYYYNHRIIFLYHHGYLPKCIDHIDGNCLNNSIENLREASLYQNQQNRKIAKNNTSGIKGIYKIKNKEKWCVRLKVNGKQNFFGNYHDLEVAKFVIETMRYKYHHQFANNGL